MESLPSSRNLAASNRRLGWALFGIFAGLSVFSVLYIAVRAAVR